MATAKNNLQNNFNQEQDINVLIRWEFPENRRYQRSLGWYVAAIFLFGILFFISIITSNFLFTIIIVMSAFIIIDNIRRPALTIDFVVNEDGIIIGQKFYDYRDLEKFWICYHPPEVKKLYLEFKNKFKAPISIPIENQSPLILRNILLEFIEEDIEKEDELTAEALARILKIT